jgi:hypothetical protein
MCSFQTLTKDLGREERVSSLMRIVRIDLFAPRRNLLCPKSIDLLLIVILLTPFYSWWGLGVGCVG